MDKNNKDNREKLTLIVVGDSSVGKTAFLKR